MARTKTVAQALIAEGKKWEVLTGDVEQVCKTLAADSFDAVLSDPPYGLSFMGKAWDYAVPGPALWREVLRVLRPGAPNVAFSGTRTYHRTAVGIEDGGFTVQDMFSWIYGEGWPKGQAVDKLVDKRLGAEREITGSAPARSFAGWESNAGGKSTKLRSGVRMDKPATPEAEAWLGYNTQLKPGQEPAVLAYKPREGTFAENAMKHGVGGLHVEACRVGETGGRKALFDPKSPSQNNVFGHKGNWAGWIDQEMGRWPSNVLMDSAAARALEERFPGCSQYFKVLDFEEGEREALTVAVDRFFYASKANEAERGSKNDHPTVKPIALMKYLATMLRPPKPNGRILVPFCGSGSEMLGCLLAGWSEVVGIELDPRMADVARWRISNARVNRVEIVVGGR